jgi:hypothetical protein
MEWDGIGWVGIGWVGIGWVGIGWDGIGWVGIGWVGIGWVGIGSCCIIINLSILKYSFCDDWDRERMKAKECARAHNKVRGMAHIRRMKSIHNRVDRLVEFQTNLQSTLLAHSDAVYGGEMMESLNNALSCLRDAGKKVNVDDAEKVRDEFFAVASKMEDVWKVMDGMREDQELLDDERRSPMDDVDSELLDEYTRLEEDLSAESEEKAKTKVKVKSVHSNGQRSHSSHETAEMEDDDGKEGPRERVYQHRSDHAVAKKMGAMEL